VVTVKTQPKRKPGNRDTSSTESVGKSIAEKFREHAHVELSLTVTACTAKGEIKGRLSDLSLSGAFILLPGLPDPTQQIKLIIDIPQTSPLVLNAQIVRLEIRPAGDGSSHHCGLGVSFTDISDEDRLHLLDALLG